MSSTLREFVAPPERSREWSRVLSLALASMFVGTNLAAYIHAYWSVEYFLATSAYLLIALILAFPDVEVWQIGMEHYDE